jgi:hypothetical protein
LQADFEVVLLGSFPAAKSLFRVRQITENSEVLLVEQRESCLLEKRTPATIFEFLQDPYGHRHRGLSTWNVLVELRVKVLDWVARYGKQIQQPIECRPTSREIQAPILDICVP